MELEEAEYERLLKLATPKVKSYQEYIQRTNDFIHYFSSFSKILKNNPDLKIKKLSMRQSKIFNKKYLVASFDEAYFQSICPNLDAAATPSLDFLSVSSPPLVIIPDSKKSNRTPHFLSVLEHEFVHINQAIVGRYPETNFGTENIKKLVDLTFAEYQAYFIENFNYPDSIREPLEQYSLQEWSLLRGFTQALERLTLAIHDGTLSPKNVETTLKEFPLSLPFYFEEANLDKKEAVKYLRHLPKYFQTALDLVASNKDINKSQEVLEKWILLQKNYYPKNFEG